MAPRIVCARCRGRRIIETRCSQCGDSTWDHECDDTEEPCPDCARAPASVFKVLADVMAERAKQDARWGEQNHQMIGSRASLRELYRIPDHVEFHPETYAVFECARLGMMSEREAKSRCDEAHKAGSGTYSHIHIEEVVEFITACVVHGETSDEARKEAVQMAAVACAIVECIDRKRAAHKGGAK